MILDDFFNSGFFGVVVGVRKPAGKGVSDGLSSIIEVNLDWLINCCVKRLECDDNSSGVGNCGKESLFFDLIDMFDLDCLCPLVFQFEFLLILSQETNCSLLELLARVFYAYSD